MDPQPEHAADLTPCNPPKVITTDRLVLRTWQTEAEIDTAIELVMRNRDHLRDYMSWVQGSDEEIAKGARDYCRNAQATFESGTEFPYAIWFNDNPIGACSLHPDRGAADEIDIGYWLSKDHSGHGYMTEAARALTTSAFTIKGKSTVRIECDESNVRSAAVAQRLGFQLMATYEHAIEAPSMTGTFQLWTMHSHNWNDTK